ncbi:MAG: HD-GYP domain-containing protein [Gammaproteobacteria bacterium]|nr:HD-GYP domain-containing protein [Gammaproteobacteria bacterium]
MLLDFFRTKKDQPKAAGRKPASRNRIKHAQDKKNRFEKIPVDQLRIGMYVRELDIPWEESSFLFQGIDVKTQQDILDVQRQCKHVWVDYTEFRLANNKPDTITNAFTSSNSLIEVEDEYEDALDAHTQARQVMTNIFQDIRLGGEVDVGQIKQSVSGSVDSIMRNPDASLWLTRLQETDNYTAQHSLNVAALSIITGRSLGLSKEEMQNLGVCAVMHDIGKAQLPQELFSKSQLTEDEKALIKTHPQLGHKILQSSKNMYSGAADVALWHHEHVDGKGYPHGLTAEKIPLFAKIVAITDTYDSMTSQRPGTKTLSPSEGLDYLYALRGKRFDEELVLKFIDGIGIFPAGSIVEMTNGEVGIVLSSTKDKLKPKVILILDQIKDAAIQQVIDLSQMTVDTAGKPYQIKTTLRDGSYGIVVDEFQRAGLRIG